MSGRGVDVKGRTKKDARHVRLYQFELDTLAYRSLCVGARALLIEIRALFKGTNNGELFLAVREAGRRLNVGKSLAAEWFDELQDRGFIRPKVEAGFTWKTAARARKATCWTLTNESTDNAAPTRDYQHWAPRPESTRGPENIRRSAPADSLSAPVDSLSAPADSDPRSVRPRGQIRPNQRQKPRNLSAPVDTVSYQLVADGKADAGDGAVASTAAGAPGSGRNISSGPKQAAAGAARLRRDDLKPSRTVLQSRAPPKRSRDGPNRI